METSGSWPRAHAHMFPRQHPDTLLLPTLSLGPGPRCCRGCGVADVGDIRQLPPLRQHAHHALQPAADGRVLELALPAQLGEAVPEAGVGVGTCFRVVVHGGRPGVGHPPGGGDGAELPWWRTGWGQGGACCRLAVGCCGGCDWVSGG